MNPMAVALDAALDSSKAPKGKEGPGSKSEPGIQATTSDAPEADKENADPSPLKPRTRTRMNLPGEDRYEPGSGTKMKGVVDLFGCSCPLLLGSHVHPP